MSEITEKNTKSEIMKAYEGLLAKVRETSPNNKKVEKEAEVKKELVVKAASNSNEQIITNIANLKLDIVNVLDRLGDQMLTEFKQLSILQEAILSERKQIEELHEISVSADTLAALLLGHREQTQRFEADMQEQRASWNKERALAESSLKEVKAKLQQDHEREEEVYTYRTKLERQKDADQYATRKASLELELTNKKNALEQEWTSRTTELSTREAEFKDLQEKAKEFPGLLEKSIQHAKAEVEEKLVTQHAYESQLKTKEYEGELRLFKQMVSTLETKIQEKDLQLSQLSEKANKAGSQVQEIAIKAIEGASNSRHLTPGFSGRQLEIEKAN